MSSEEADEPLTPAEKRASGLLALLRDDLPRAPVGLTEGVVRSARWQRAARGTLALIGELVAAATVGTEILLGIERRDPPGEDH